MSEITTATPTNENLYDTVMNLDGVDDKNKVFILQKLTQFAFPQTSEPIQIVLATQKDDKKPRKRQQRREIPLIYRCICKKNGSDCQCGRRHSNIELTLEELKSVASTPEEYKKLCCKSHASTEFQVSDVVLQSIQELDQETFDKMTEEYKNRNKKRKRPTESESDAEDAVEDGASPEKVQKKVQKKKKKPSFKEKLYESLKDIENKHFIRGVDTDGAADLPEMQNADMDMKYFNHDEKYGICHDTSDNVFYFIDMSKKELSHHEISKDKYEKVIEKLHSVFQPKE
jgi:hypothetical protein